MAAAATTDADGKPVSWLALYLGFGGMAIGQFMSVLDIQIVSASLPQVQAGVGASADEVSWVQTAYLIAEVIMMPLSAYLSRAFGTQKVYMVSCVGFLVMSVVAGFSTSVDMLIIARGLQGFLGGAMIPTVFAVAFTAFPPERRATANIVTGMIVTLAPTVGPTFGGHLTELLDWRWLFFINVIPGLVSLFLVARFGNFDRGDRKILRGFDWWGLAGMAIFLITALYVIEEGAKDSWFADDIIFWFTVIAAITGLFFVHRQLTRPNPIIQLKAFSNRNFALGILITSLSGMALYGGTFLMPLYLARIRQFSASEIGTTMLVSGLAMFVTGPMLGRVVREVDPRIPIVAGMGMIAWGMWLGHSVNGEWGFWEFAGLQAFRGVGVMTAMIATSQMTMGTLPPHMIKDASSLLNLSRNVGGAIGLAVLNSMLTTQTRVHMTDISSQASIVNPEPQAMMAGLIERMAALGVADPEGAAAKAFSFMMAREAQILAFGDGFALLAAGAVVAGLCGLMTAPRKPVPTSLKPVPP